MFVVGSNSIAAEGEIGGKGQDDVRFFHTEKEALEKWLEWALEVDADCWTTFEAQVALCALISSILPSFLTFGLVDRGHWVIWRLERGRLVCHLIADEYAGQLRN